MGAATYDEDQGRAFIREAIDLVARASSEDVLRHALSAKLPLMFPGQPWWIKSHVTGSESLASFHEAGKKRYGFIDVLVGSTVVEYERDLRPSTAFDHGLHQVKQYCAAQLNNGARPDQLMGILSDTVRWFAYSVANISELSNTKNPGSLGPDDVDLVEVDTIDLTPAGDSDCRKLGAFLQKYLGREGARKMAAATLSADLGFDSAFCANHLALIDELLDTAFKKEPSYSALIERLWTDYVCFLGGQENTGTFDKESYAGELYILTLAKLICANVLSNKALASDNAELKSILDGGFFRARGLPNLVEYDYFGWINADPHVSALIDISREIQDDLRAYDFESTPAEDLFGTLMARLASRSQRLLLGQEWTPSWLAERIVKKVASGLPEGSELRFLDMCCGSGAMVIETVKLAQQRLLSAGYKPGDAVAQSEIANAVTAFDIDPLAVMLAKVGWILASKHWLVPGSEVQIPVYHADSLFANTPITQIFGADGHQRRRLQLDTEEVDLPHLLFCEPNQALFDPLLSRGYGMAMSSAAAKATTLSDQEIEAMTDSVVTEVAIELSDEDRSIVLSFCKDLLRALERLQRNGKNGIWAFVLGNSFRPALLAGRFNGVVTNPPWLALSKISNNPYRDALKVKAASLGIKAPGASHLHVEIATIFLLHAVERYLADGALVGCVLPDTILNGVHHQPFRGEGYLTATTPVKLTWDEIWKVASDTFKNNAVVLFGRKREPDQKISVLPGRSIGKSSDAEITYQLVRSSRKTAWTTKSSKEQSGWSSTSESIGRIFRQGADIMPRGVIFHAVSKIATGWKLSPVSAGSPFHYLRVDGHVRKDFSLAAVGVSDQVMFDVLLSKHLAPYELAPGAKAFLPLAFGADGWSARTESSIAGLGAATSVAMKSVLSAIRDSADGFFNRIESDRKKLSVQRWNDDDWIIVASAGGKLPCAAYVRGKIIPCDKTIIDQTLYWAKVSNEDEAIYIVGLVNCPAVKDLIQAFQPRGSFGERHVHKLVFDRTPPFDPGNDCHVRMVAATRELLDQWRLRRTASDIEPYVLSPEKSLIVRRKKVRAVLESLPAWNEYCGAAAAVYGSLGL